MSLQKIYAIFIQYYLYFIVGGIGLDLIERCHSILSNGFNSDFLSSIDSLINIREAHSNVSGLICSNLMFFNRLKMIWLPWNGGEFRQIKVSAPNICHEENINENFDVNIKISKLFWFYIRTTCKSKSPGNPSLVPSLFSLAPFWKRFVVFTARVVLNIKEIDAGLKYNISEI